MRHWFITGISRGLGLALAKAALARGNRVVGTIRKGPAPLAADTGQLQVLTVDMADTHAVEAAVHQAFAAFGRLDVIVNNAGSGLFGAVEDTTQDELRALFNVDVFAPICIIRTAVPHLRAQGSGHIVNITSIAARAPGTGAALYAAAKAALEGLTAAIAPEIMPFGIKVTAVAPGQFRTGFMSDSSVHKTDGNSSVYAGTVGASLGALVGTYQRQLGDPDRAAQVIIDMVESADPPQNLLLGSDAYHRAQARLENVIKEMERWKLRTLSTDYGS